MTLNHRTGSEVNSEVKLQVTRFDAYKRLRKNAILKINKL